MSNPSGEGFAYGDHQLDATKALRLVAHLETEGLALASLIHPQGDDDSAGADLLSLAEAALEVGGIEVDVGVAPALQRVVQKRLHLLVNLLADAIHLRLGDGALGAQSRDQDINLAGGYATDVVLHDHAIEGLVHPAPGLKDGGQKAAGPQLLLRRSLRLGNLQRDGAHLDRQGAGSVAVAVPEPLLGALVPVGTQEGRELQLDQPLQAIADDLRDQLPGSAAIQ